MKENNTPLLSIIIINHNTYELTKRTVQAVIDTVKKFSYELIIVDNSDKKTEQFSCPDACVKVFLGVENKGFAHGCNWGVHQSCGRYLLFLNSDTEVGKDAIDKSVEYLVSHSSVGALGIKTVLPDGSFDAACKRGFPTPFASMSYFLGLEKLFPKSKFWGKYHLTYLSNDDVCSVDAIAGAYLLMPRELFLAINGFDETYFMYGEDLDLCMKIKMQSRDIIYYPDVQMVHYKRQSGLALSNPKIIDAFYDSMKIFYNKYYRSKYPEWLNLCVMKAIDLKHNKTIRASQKRL